MHLTSQDPHLTGEGAGYEPSPSLKPSDVILRQASETRRHSTPQYTSPISAPPGAHSRTLLPTPPPPSPLTAAPYLPGGLTASLPAPPRGSQRGGGWGEGVAHIRTLPPLTAAPLPPWGCSQQASLPPHQGLTEGHPGAHSRTLPPPTYSSPLTHPPTPRCGTHSKPPTPSPEAHSSLCLQGL